MSARITKGEVLPLPLSYLHLLLSAKTFKPYLTFYVPRTADILNVSGFIGR